MDTTLKSVTLQNREFLKDTAYAGGELTGFYKDNNIYRIYKSAAASFRVELSEYYYKKKQLIFVHKKISEYVYNDSSKKYDYTKINITFSGFYYFNNEKLIDSKISIQNNFSRKSYNPERNLLEESKVALEFIAEMINSLK